MPTFRGLRMRRGSANGSCYDVGASRSRTDSALVFGRRGSHELSVNPKLEGGEERGEERLREVGNPEVPDRVESEDRK